jgi:flagellar biosynthesis protein FlhF
MIEVKKFRAATTRAALEQIKLELGENAFVLETKKVKTRTFFGLKSTPEIEITATASAFNEKPAAKTQKTEGILNLREESIASPINSSKVSEFKKVMTNTFSGKPDFLSIRENPEYQMKGNSLRKEIEPVEISTEMPRIVHPRKEAIKVVTAEQKSASCGTAEKINPTLSSHDFELLRAELRELKFSFGAFSAKQRQRSLENELSGRNPTESSDTEFDQACIELSQTGVCLKLAHIELTENGISAKLARKIVSGVIPEFKAGQIGEEELAEVALERFISKFVKFETEPLKLDSKAIMAFVGPTGVGKTTTIAKIAARVSLQQNRRVELVTLDTYRISAVEQLKTYAEIIGAGFHTVRSIVELDFLIRGFPENTVVLIDTMGRSPHDLAGQYELSEYLRLNENITKCLALQANTHPADAETILKKFEMFGADCLVLTKLDETSQPSRLLETITESSLPMAYLCTGQRVPEDMLSATPKSLISRIYGEKQVSFKK